MIHGASAFPAQKRSARPGHPLSAVGDSIEWQPKAAVERHNRNILVRTAGLCDTTYETRR
jgi:hypothetical protein